jgi:hypothetical protein
MLWDITFLYSIRPAGEPGVRTFARVEAGPRDANALAAVRFARDLETPPDVRPADLVAPPSMDADLSEWAEVSPRPLEGLMDWKPDFTHESSRKSRLVPGEGDLSARVRLGTWRDSYHVAIEVVDDIHVAESGSGLWRGDSVSLLQTTARGAEVEPVVLTIAFAGGEPRYELGTPAGAFAHSGPRGGAAAPGPGTRQETLSLPAGAAGNRTPVSASIRFAAWRNETRGITTYEIEIPKSLWPIESGVYWDLVVSENDGVGREGGLQIASGPWGIEETGAGGILVETGE